MGSAQSCCCGHPGDTQDRSAHSSPAQQKAAPSQPAFPPVDKSIHIEHPFLGGQQAQDVTEVYDIGQVLGVGQYGTTRVAIQKATGRKFACKSINKARVRGMEADVKRELDIMHYLSGHPNIVRLKEAFEDHVYVHLIMELCTGGDLVERITAKGTYTERDAAEITRTMLKVVAYCHDNHVVHRDLKLENLLLADESHDTLLKATDFGMSVFLSPGQHLHEECGTAFYMAPEVLMRDYNELADVWAVGVILYILLCGRPPFEDRDDYVIFNMIVEGGKPDFSGDNWKNITEPAKECVRLMMTYDFKKRPTARDMLQHDWIREGGVAGDNIIEPEVLHRMRSFAAMNKLKQQALLFIGQRMSPQEVAGLHELFASIDTDGSGTISLEELKTAVASKGASVSEAELQKLIDLADVDHNHEIDWQEFIAATMQVSKLQQEQHLVDAFKNFDTDNSGYLSRDELAAALRSSSLNEPQLQGDIDKVLAECDKNGDGQIDYGEFCAMMLQNEKASAPLSSATVFANQLAKRQTNSPTTDATAGSKSMNAKVLQQQQQLDSDVRLKGGDQSVGLQQPGVRPVAVA